MGDCLYCGKPAGFFKRWHKECDERAQAEQAAAQKSRDEAHAAIVSCAAQLLSTGTGETELRAAVEHAEEKGVPPDDARKAIIQQWHYAVDNSMEDGVIDESEQKRLIDYLNATAIDRDTANRNGHFDRMVQGVVLHELFSGHLPQRFNFSDRVPVNLQKGESVVWGFPNTQYIETRTRIERVGGSQGVSLRIMSGVYYRVGGFKSRPVEKTEARAVDSGWLILTDKNIYFAGATKSLRIPYNKIVSFEPYSDGIGLMRDAQAAKPQTFVTGEGWFVYNLATNLAQRTGSA